jgi:hypothetical protein
VRKGAAGGKGAPGTALCSLRLFYLRFVRSTMATHIVNISADPGTRPGLHGQTLISMGLVDLDRLMGGGLPLGTLTLIIEVRGRQTGDGYQRFKCHSLGLFIMIHVPQQDQHSGQHLNLLRYFLGEGLATGQVGCTEDIACLTTNPHC